VSAYKKIGLYGGSFDPVHLGHLLVAQAALEELELDRLFFIPARQSPFKPDQLPSPANLRLKLLRLALLGMNRCEVDDQEIRREGISYTIETVRDYRTRFPQAKFFFLIGADHVNQLSSWKAAEELVRELHFCVVPRAGGAIQPAVENGAFTVLKGFPFQVSSSQIRERVRAGRSIRHLVPAALEEGILNSGLYL
jgi:nicotinate-nucleotide adenylyltransferase